MTAPIAPLDPTPPPGFTAQHATVNGFVMHYVRGGSGPTVLVLHGFPQTWAEWRDQLETLAQHHTVIAPDLRGTGDSAITADGYDAVQLADDLHTLLVDLGLHTDVQIIAHDIGAWAAYPYAATWPAEVSRMILAEGPLPDETMYHYPALGPGGAPSIWHYGFFQLDMAEKLITGHEIDLVEGFVTQFLGRREAFTPADFELWARYLRRPGRVRAWLQMYRSIHESAVQNQRLREQGRLEMPVLGIGGEFSLGDSIGTQLERYAADVTVAVLPGSGHWIVEEQPAALTRLITDFLR